MATSQNHELKERQKTITVYSAKSPGGAKLIGKKNIIQVVKSPSANEINRDLSIASLYLKSNAIRKPVTNTMRYENGLHPPKALIY